jgi:CBS domain-containing protein
VTGDATPAAEVMKPVEPLHRIDAREPVTKALDAIVEEDVNQLPVLEQGRIRGVISRDQILRLVAELSM